MRKEEYECVIVINLISVKTRPNMNIVHAQTFTHTHAQKKIHTRKTHTYVHKNVHTRMNASVNGHTPTHLCIYSYIHKCLHANIHVYI